MWINSYFFVVHICTEEGKAPIIILDFLEISTMNSRQEFSIDLVFESLREYEEKPTLGKDWIALQRKHDKHFKFSTNSYDLLRNCISFTLGKFARFAIPTLLRKKIWKEEDEIFLSFLHDARDVSLEGVDIIPEEYISLSGDGLEFKESSEFTYKPSHPSFEYNNLIEKFEINEAITEENERESHHRSYGNSRNPHVSHDTHNPHESHHRRHDYSKNTHSSHEIPHRSYEGPWPHFLNTPHKPYDDRRRNEYEETKPRTGNPFYITDEDYERKQKKEKYRREFVEDLKQAIKYVD